MWTVVPDIYNVIIAPHIQASIFDWTYLRYYWRQSDMSMRVILHSWCQIQHTSLSLLYVNCGPGHIQCIYRSAYSDFNVHLNVSALLLEISRQFNERYTAILVPNTAHVTLCVLWSRKYTTYLQLLIFRPQYSTERICAAIGDIPTLRCALYCKLGDKYSAHRPVYAVWTVVPHIYNVVTTPHIQASIFSCRQLPCYWWYLDNPMRVILHSCCRIKRTSSSLRYVICGPGHIQSIFSTAYLGFNIQLKVSALQLEIFRYFDARYTANLATNTAHFLQISLCEQWCRTYTMYLQLRIFNPEYST
jgi:hypothetical protein